MGSIKLLAAENVAPEIAVWTRFWAWIFLYFLNIPIGILERIIANNAPTIDVFVLIPILTISSSPIIAPKTDKIIFNINIDGLNADGCSGVLFVCPLILTPP